MSHPGTEATTAVIPLRYRDLDTLGHVNQSVYHVILEEARVTFLYALFGRSMAFVVARVEMDYRHETRISDRELHVETAVEGIGRSSIRLASRMTTPSGALTAEAITVLVAWDREQRCARPLTDDERAALTAVGVAETA